MAEDFYAQKKKDVWQTPEPFVNKLGAKIGGWDLDPCAGESTDHARTNYTIEDDGLSKEWFGTVFCNPPFSQKNEWIDKVVEEHASGRTDMIVLLTPDSTDVQSWYHGKIAPNAKYKWFKEGRMSFIDPETGDDAGSATFGTMLSIFTNEPVPEEAINHLTSTGDLVESVE